MKTRTLIATAAVALTGVLAGTAQAATPTEVTIKGQNGDYYGYVKSSDSDCESNRKVNVYKVLGLEPGPPERPEDRLRHRPAQRPRRHVVDRQLRLQEGQVLRPRAEDQRVQGRHQPRHQPLVTNA